VNATHASALRLWFSNSWKQAVNDSQDVTTHTAQTTMRQHRHAIPREGLNHWRPDNVITATIAPEMQMHTTTMTTD
jgi:hypothetical protein